MLVKSFILAVAVATAVSNGNPLKTATTWYAPLVANRLAGIQLSSQSGEHVLYNEFTSFLHRRWAFVITCTPNFYHIAAQSEWCYYDVNYTAHHSTENYQSCTVNNAHRAGPQFQVAQCTGGRNTLASHMGHVDAASNRYYVIAELCFDQTLIFGRSRLQRVSATGEQLSLAATSLFQYDNRYDNIGDSDTLHEVTDDMKRKIEADVLPESWNATAIQSMPHTYDSWIRFIENAHKLGLGYLENSALVMSYKLVQVVEHLRARVAGTADDVPIVFYTGFVGEMESLTDDDQFSVTVPKYVWFATTTTTKKAIVYVVPNGSHAVDPEICANQCNETVHCCEVVGFVQKHVKRLQWAFEGEYEL